ncbi:MAG: phosphocholine cytidylyltransferase family protein [Rhodospirillaceae bacterium]
MKTAVILAAGKGSRLRPLTDRMPKACVPVAQRSLVRRLVSQLLACQLDMPIYIAAGYLADMIRAEVAEFGPCVTIVENPDYAVTNNMESCRLALEARREDSSTLIINADCIYDDAIVAGMVAADHSCIATDSSVYYEESMKVRAVDGRLTEISKMLSDAGDTSTSIDIYSFEPDHVADLYSIMRGFHESGDVNQWTEVAIGSLLARPEARVVAADMKGLRWVEIDNHDDLARAEALWS